MFSKLFTILRNTKVATFGRHHKRGSEAFGRTTSYVASFAVASSVFFDRRTLTLTQELGLLAKTLPWMWHLAFFVIAFCLFGIELNKCCFPLCAFGHFVCPPVRFEYFCIRTFCMCPPCEKWKYRRLCQSVDVTYNFCCAMAAPSCHKFSTAASIKAPSSFTVFLAAAHLFCFILIQHLDFATVCFSWKRYRYVVYVSQHYRQFRVVMTPYMCRPHLLESAIANDTLRVSPTLPLFSVGLNNFWRIVLSCWCFNQQICFAHSFSKIK